MLFTAPEPWSKDVSCLAKNGSSDAIIAALDKAGGWGGGRLQIDFSIPLFFADSSTPRRTINGPMPGGYSYCYGGPDCEAVPLQMPIPANGNAEGSNTYTCDTTYQTDGQGDCHILVVETSQKKLYELYNATADGTAIDALGAFIWDLTKAYPDNERGDQCTSADAGGFPIAGLLPTADEVAAGAVNHALRFILPNPYMREAAYVHPASHAGSPSSKDANAPPYGVRFRLKAAFDDSSYNAGEKVIIAAMKKYGMLLSDGGTIALTFADDRTTTAKSVGLERRRHRTVILEDHPRRLRGGRLQHAGRLDAGLRAQPLEGRGRPAVSESNPMRWVVLAIVAAALFAVGIVTVVQGQVDAAKAQAAAAALASEARVARADEQVTGLLERAAAVAGPFVADVGAGRFAQAYARLAAPYRANVSLADFTRSCRASPILAGARQVMLRRLRTQTGGGAATLEAEGMLDSTAGAVPMGFVFLQEEGVPRILVVSLAGVPVLQGVAPSR